MTISGQRDRAVCRVKDVRSATFITSLVVIAAISVSFPVVPPAAEAVSITTTIALSAEPEGLDPALGLSNSSWAVTHYVYETLVNYAEGGSLPEPGLAQDWTVSPDGLTWTFNLRPGVKFQNGDDANAAAVVYNLERWWDPAHPAHTGDFLYFEYLFGGFRGDPNSLLAGVSSTGALQVQIRLTRPDNGLPSILAPPAFGIASPAAIQAGTLNTSPVGTAAFRFTEWVAGDHIRLDTFTDYWGATPRVAHLSFRFIPAGPARFAALQAGEVEAADDLPAELIPAAIASPDLKVFRRPSVSLGYLGINRAHPPLDSPLVRQAIAHAINKERILQLFYPFGAEVAGQLLPPEVWGHDFDLADYGYDPALARSLLAQAGYAGGFTIKLATRTVSRAYLPDPRATAELIQQDLLAIGINATLVIYDSGTFIAKVYNGELDLFLLGWGADYLHPDNFFTPMLCDEYLAYGPKDDVLCDQLAALETEPSLAVQLNTYRWASRRVHDTLPLAPLALAGNGFPVTRRNVAGLTASPLWIEDFSNMYTPASRVHMPVQMR